MRRLARVLLVVPFVLAACSSGGDDKVGANPRAAVAAAARQTAANKTVQMSLTIGDGKTKLGTGTGAFDFTNEHGRFKLSTTLGVNVELVFTKDAAYLKNPR